MRTTMAEVAARAGVSKMTVSNVLNGRRARVSEPVRQRVLALIDEMSYVPVRFATQNRRVETKVIGVVLGTVGALPILPALQLGAARHGYDLLLLMRRTDDCYLDREEAQFLDRRCDGYLFCSGHYPVRVFRSLRSHGTPVAACFSTEVPGDVPWTVPDNHAAMAQAVEHLVGLGHRRIAHFAGPQSHTEARQRLDGFRAAIAAHGLTPRDDLVVTADNWGGVADRNREACDRLVATGASAVVCANDALALDLWSACDARGLRVPHDLSLTGMDDIPDGARRGLATVDNPVERIVLAALDSLVGVIRAQGDPVNKTVPVKLIARASTGAPSLTHRLRRD